MISQSRQGISVERRVFKRCVQNQRIEVIERIRTESISDVVVNLRVFRSEDDICLLESENTDSAFCLRVSNKARNRVIGVKSIRCGACRRAITGDLISVELHGQPGVCDYV